MICIYSYIHFYVVFFIWITIWLDDNLVQNSDNWILAGSSKKNVQTCGTKNWQILCVFDYENFFA